MESPESNGFISASFRLLNPYNPHLQRTMIIPASRNPYGHLKGILNGIPVYPIFKQSKMMYELIFATLVGSEKTPLADQWQQKWPPPHQGINGDSHSPK